MYLSNNEILEILDEMEFEIPTEKYPFNPIEQVRLCSIDIRLSNVFWYQKKLKWGQSIDLKHGKLFEISPTRLWKKRIFEYSDKIVLKPGEMILGQTFEKFTIPKRYAGKIITRSSYTRLGIETSCTNDFINPGYRGRVTLEIINNSINTIVLYPMIPICQIMVIPLTSSPQGTYGDSEISSKYQNEDGSPSLWWRDNLVKAIENKLSAFDYSTDLINSLDTTFHNLDDECIDRFYKFILNLKGHEITSKEDLISRFMNREKQKETARLALKIIIPLMSAFPIGVLVNNITSETINILYVICSSIVLVIMLIFIVQLISDKKNFYTGD